MRRETRFNRDDAERAGPDAMAQMIRCMDQNARDTEWALEQAQTPSSALGAVYREEDIPTLETAAESLMRFRDVQNAIALWAIALRLRVEATE